MTDNGRGNAATPQDDSWEDLLEVMADRTSTVEARDFHKHLGLDLFAGGLLRLLPYRGSFTFDDKDIACRFTPAGFPNETDFEPIHQAIEEALFPDLREELESFIVESNDPILRADRNGRPLGANSLRTILRKVSEEPDDFVGWVGDSRIPALTVEFGPTDWWHIQAYCNRLHDDPTFRSRALERGWVREGVPFNRSGKVPSFVAAHVVVTAGTPDDPFVVLTQRRGHLRYYPDLWEVGVAENHHGPRLVTKDKQPVWLPGDRDLHQCALRGLSEELGVHKDDVESLVLLGFFVEAAFGAIVAMFHAHVPISWRDLRRRVARLAENGHPLEANIIAREPLSTANMVRLFFEQTYEPASLELDRAIVAGGLTGPSGFHPAVPARILQYLIADQQRHQRQELIAEVQSVIERVDHSAATSS